MFLEEGEQVWVLPCQYHLSAVATGSTQRLSRGIEDILWSRVAAVDQNRSAQVLKGKTG